MTIYHLGQANCLLKAILIEPVILSIGSKHLGPFSKYSDLIAWAGIAETAETALAVL